MKLKNFALLLTLSTSLLFASCISETKGRKITSNHSTKITEGYNEDNTSNNYKKVTYKIGNFNSISSSMVANIHVKQGSTPQLRVEGHELFINNLDISVKDNTLNINAKDERVFRKLKRKNKLIIYVTIPQLISLSNSGVSNIDLQGTFNSPSLKISNTGVGNIITENIETEILHVTSEGVGNITLKGRTNNMTVSNEGVGNVQAESMIGKNVKVTNEGVGNVSIYASDSINVESNGIGSITYYGNPKVKNIQKYGMGKVKAGN